MNAPVLYDARDEKNSVFEYASYVPVCHVKSTTTKTTYVCIWQPTVTDARPCTSLVHAAFRHSVTTSIHTYRERNVFELKELNSCASVLFGQYDTYTTFQKSLSPTQFRILLNSNCFRHDMSICVDRL